jgi:formylglycine-generating enzyme required for sulfatase activity
VFLIVFIAGYFFDSKRVKSEREEIQAELIKMRSIYPDLLLDADGSDKKTGIRYLPIPPGKFMMGYKRRESDVRPIHSVSVKGFFMSESEVTNEQYRLCVDAGVCTQPHTVKPKCSWGKESYDQYPVNCVTWSQARTFAQWAGGELPTEAQWEYAAREGMNRPKRLSLTSPEEAWYEQNSDGAPHPVKKEKS